MPDDTSFPPTSPQTHWRSFAISIGAAVGMTLGVLVGMGQNDIPLWLTLGTLLGLGIGAYLKRGGQT